MKTNRRAIEKDLLMLVFYAKGGIDLDTAYQMSSEQRKSLIKIIENHYEKLSGTEQNNFDI